MHWGLICVEAARLDRNTPSADDLPDLVEKFGGLGLTQVHFFDIAAGL